MSTPLDTLIKLTEARNYNQWVYNLCKPHLGKRLLEIGCGIGNMTDYFLAHPHLLATDIDDNHLQQARARQQGRTHYATDIWDVATPPSATVRAYQPDTVICINILEHVENDAVALRNIYELLPAGGKLVLFVPALQMLFGTLDEELLHYRRYSKKAVQNLVAQSGFKTQKLKYVNSLGVFGWWLNSRVFKRRYFSKRQVAVYDKIIPALAWMEKLMPPMLGQSVLCIGCKP